MFRTRFSGVSALALTGALAASAAHAQTATPPAATTLPAVTVTAPQTGSPTVPSVEDQRQALNQTVGSVGFVDAASYQDTYASTLRDVLKDTPGVFVQNRYGQELRLSIRGSGIGRAFHTRGIEVLQDGIPFNFADGSGDFYQVDPLALRSAEVLKGGNALAYGASTLGGAVNFVSPTARTAFAPNTLRLDGGSFGTLRGSAQASRIVGDFDMLGSFTATHSDGFRKHSDGQYEQFNGNLGYRISPSVETRFYVGAYLVHQRLPGSLTLDQALHTPRMANAAALSGDQARNTWTQRIANRTSVTLDVGQIDVDTWLVHKELFHPIFQVIDQDSLSYGIAPRYTGSLNVGGYRNDVIAGMRAWAGYNAAYQYVNLGGNSGAQTANGRQKARNYEAYFENRWFFLPTVALMTGAKILHDERDYTDRLTPAKSASKDYDGVNPKAGFLWEPQKNIQAFVDVTRSRDIPDFSDLNQTQSNGAIGFVPLQAQRAWTTEIGTRGRTDDHRFGWDVTAYRSEIRGEMLQYTTNPSVPAATFNAGKTRHQGLELGARADIIRDVTGPGSGDTISVSQLWNWSDFKFRGDRQYGNNRLAGTPEHVFRTSLSYTRRDGFYFTPSLDIVPQGAWVDYANSQRPPGYTLLGIQTGIDFDNGLSLFLDARNLTDKRYITDLGTVTDARTTATSVYYPGDGRSVFGGVRLAF